MRKILFLILGKSKPSSRLRILPVANRLQEKGHGVTVLDIPATLLGRLRLLRLARQHDLVVLQKKLLPSVLINRLCSLGCPVIFDVDDAVCFQELERGELLTGVYFSRYVNTCRQVRTVVAGNLMLAEFAINSRASGYRDVVVLPSAIDTVALFPDSERVPDGRFVVGWIGTKGNLGQLITIAGALRRAQLEIPGFVLRVIADKPPEISGLNIEFIPWAREKERAVLTELDVGLMPLEDTLWNRGKGGFKLLQYMAVGVPGVASPVGINCNIVTHGENGLLAKSEDEWLDCILRLARFPDERRQMANAARQTVLRDYSLHGFIDAYEVLIEQCLS